MAETPKEWWVDHMSTRPGPSRIRVTLNRDLTHAEREHLRSLGRLITGKLGDKFRVGNDDRIYIESLDYDSRQLFAAISASVAAAFVNVFPIAVRTFRERVEGLRTAKPSYGLMDTITTTVGNMNIAYEPRTEARPSTVRDVEAVVGPVKPKVFKAKKKAKK